VVWGGALKEGFRAALVRPLGRVVLGGTALAVVTGIGAAARLVAQVQGEPFTVRTAADVRAEVAAGRVNDPVPEFRLVDQHGDSVTMDRFQGRPVIVTFGYGHCETVCPLTVHAARAAAGRLSGGGAVLLVVTLDPWRDTPERLGSVARQWELGEGMYLLGGDVAAVERALSAWRVPRVRNMATGDLSHPALVYVVSPAGRIAYALGPDTEAIVAAVEAL
jgi:protein SCO1/2